MSIGQPPPGFGNRGVVRQDGRKIHNAYLFEVKKPSESKYPYDYYKLRATIPGEQAFRDQRADLGEGDLQPQHDDAPAQAGARSQIEPGMGTRIGRNEVERQADQQSQQDDRKAIVFGQPTRRSRADRAQREARKQSREMRLIGSGRCRGLFGKMDLAEQVAAMGQGIPIDPLAGLRLVHASSIPGISGRPAPCPRSRA